LSHAFEALQVLNKINGEPELLKVVRGASEATQESFDKAIAIVGTKQWEFFRKVRNDIGFHYLPSTVRYAIHRLSDKFPNVQLSLSIGSNNLQWYYEPGDRIIDTAVVRDVFEIPENADVVKEVDKLIHEMQTISEHLADFAGKFIMEFAP
jgi:hypothetical protein